jgi:hypothetical protein
MKPSTRPWWFSRRNSSPSGILVAEPAQLVAGRVFGLVDEHGPGAERAEALILRLVLRAEVRHGRVAQFKQRLGRLLIPEPRLTILHHVVVIGAQPVPDHVARGEEAVQDRAEAVERHHGGRVHLLFGLLLARPIERPDEEGVPVGRQHERRDLFPLAGEVRPPGLHLRELLVARHHQGRVRVGHR